MPSNYDIKNSNKAEIKYHEENLRKGIDKDEDGETQRRIDELKRENQDL